MGRLRFYNYHVLHFLQYWAMQIWKTKVHSTMYAITNSDRWNCSGLKAKICLDANFVDIKKGFQYQLSAYN